MKKIVKKVVKLTPLRRLYDQIERLTKDKINLENELAVLNSVSRRKKIDQEMNDLRRRIDSEVTARHLESDQLREHASNLSARNDEWAWEVRGLRMTIQRLEEYNAWFLQNYPKEPELQAERQASKKFDYKPLISIVIPTYNTDEKLLRACLDSVLAQTYDNWQLCIADDASTSIIVSRVLEEYAKKDSRIVYKIRSQNGHICEASNTAAKLAQGEFIALLDHDDLLWPNALHKVVEALNKDKSIDFLYSDEDKVDEKGVVHSQPFFKPNFSFYFLRSTNYICHFSVVRRSLFEKIGGFRPGYEGAQDWDLFLRVTQKTSKIHHIPTILYSWRLTPNSTAMNSNVKSYAFRSQKKAIESDLKARGIKAIVKSDRAFPGIWLTFPAIKDKPLVSIVIPTKDMKEYLERCINSILQKTTYANYEIIIVENNSIKQSTFDYYKTLESNKRIKIVTWDKKPFNYSSVCNFGVENSKGDYLVMLNNDTELLEPTWLEYMLGFAQQPDVGAVGAQLLFPNNTYQHVGIVVGIGSELPVANHPFTQQDITNNDNFKEVFVRSIRECAGVTAACLMVSRKKFDQINGFDPKLRVTFNDVDLNLRLLAQGLHNLYLPDVKLYHHESVSVGRVNVNRNMDELQDAAEEMVHRWAAYLKDDPYYNPNLSKLSNNYGLDIRNDNERIRKNIDQFLEA